MVLGTALGREWVIGSDLSALACVSCRGYNLTKWGIITFHDGIFVVLNFHQSEASSGCLIRSSLPSRRPPLLRSRRSRGFYEDEDERELAKRVEEPANGVIDKLIHESGLTVKERRDLAIYVATMIKRVPAFRIKAMQLLPTALVEVKQIVHSRIAERAIQSGSDAVTIAEELAEADRIVAEYNDSPPQPVLEYINAPWPSERVSEIIRQMTWRLITPPKWEFFITSDNPAVFEPYGLSSPESEVILPLSPKCVLHGSLQRGETFLAVQPVHSTAVKNINRRIASGATRFAFCHEPAEWVLRLLRKGARIYSPMRFVGKASRSK
jgi:hypothetical protein